MISTIRLRFLVLSVLLALTAAACSSSSGTSTATADDTSDLTVEPTVEAAAEPDDEEPSAEPDDVAEDPEPESDPEPEPAEEPEPDEEAMEEPEPELIWGDIGESFVGNVTAPYSPTPAVPEEVKVYFNNGTDGTLVAIYHGPGLSDPTGLCPGNSLAAGGAFSHVSNAPAAEGACDDFPTDVGSVRVCSSNVWLYNTNIPNDSAGDVYGSLERLVDGAFEGQTAVATNSPGTPEIDYTADAYTITAMFTIDGATEIFCDAPLT